MREIEFRALYNGAWYYQTLDEILTITLAAFRLGEHKTQFTGLHDKHGKKIFEGDVISDEFLDPYEGLIVSKETVYFDETLGSWMLDQSDKQDRSYCTTLAENLLDYEYTVIGNIYEHPQLLQK